MTVCKLYQTINQLSSGQRLLGLDIGKKTMGWQLATPMPEWLPFAHFMAQEIYRCPELIAIIAEHDIGGLVLGWPLNMDGSEGPSCDSLRDFAHAFLRLHDIAISFQDERLSTKAVEQEMIAADLTRQKRHLRRDALAATWILQSALDSLDSLRDKLEV